MSYYGGLRLSRVDANHLTHRTHTVMRGSRFVADYRDYFDKEGVSL